MLAAVHSTLLPKTQPSAAVPTSRPYARGMHYVVLAAAAEPSARCTAPRREYRRSVFRFALTMLGWCSVSSFVPSSMLSAASTPIMRLWSWLATSYLYAPKRPRLQMPRSRSHGSACERTSSRPTLGVG